MSIWKTRLTIGLLFILSFLSLLIAGVIDHFLPLWIAIVLLIAAAVISFVWVKCQHCDRLLKIRYIFDDHCTRCGNDITKITG